MNNNKWFLLLIMTLAIILTGCDDPGAVDVTAPVPGGSGAITFTNVAAGEVTVNWTAASDDIAANPLYLVCYSTSNNISTLADAEANGTAVGTEAAGITSKTVTGLNQSTTYYFNVLVSDEAGNAAAYTAASQATTMAVVYWVEYAATGKVKSANTDGTGTTEIIASAGSNPTCIDIYNGKIYWALETGGVIKRADVAGTNPQSFTMTNGNIYGIAIDETNNKIFWTDYTNNTLRKSDLDGTNEELVLSTTDNNPGAIAIGGGKVYWVTLANDKIFRADLDGTNVETVVNSFGEDAYGIALDLDNNKLYITCSETNTSIIKQADLSGTLPVTPTNLYNNANVDIPIAVAYIYDTLYWCNDNANQDIKSGLLPISSVNIVNSESTSKYGIVVK